MLTLAVSAAAHARIAPPVRWNVYFPFHVMTFDEQAVVVVATSFALIAAARARSPQAIAGALAVAAVVAAIGVVAVVNTGSIGSCVGSLNLAYTQPPAGGCPSFVGGAYLFEQIRNTVTEAVLASIVLVPAAHWAGARLAWLRARPSPPPPASPPRPSQPRPPGPRPPQPRSRPATVLLLLGASVIVIAALAGVALWGSQTSAQDVRAPGSTGRDGWIRGPGYQFRLCPSWYDEVRAGQPGRVHVVNSLTDTAIYLGNGPASPAANRVTANQLLRLGARTSYLDGARGLGAKVKLGGSRQNVWFGALGSRAYLIEIPVSAYAIGPSGCDVATMVASFRWTPG